MFQPVYSNVDALLPRFDTVANAINAYSGDDAIYVLYPEVIRQSAVRFIDGLNADILYAVKANPHPFVLETLWESGVRNYDVASIREAALVADLLPTAKLFFMHPVKSRQTIAKAYRLGVRDFSIDCLDELTKIEAVLGSLEGLHLHLRITLDGLSADNDHAAMPLTRKFGAASNDALNLLSRLAKAPCKVGISFHVGSQCLKPAAFTQAIAYVRALIDQVGITLDSLDVGGGFPVSYPGMIVAPWEAYFTEIEIALCENGFEETAVLAEPGRALVAEAGSTLARIELRKGRDLYLNEGTYGSLFDAGMCKWRYPVILFGWNDHGAYPDISETGDYTAFRFFGPTCDSLDRMEGPFMLPDEAAEGDWIEIGNLGAYGQTLATRFNSFYSETTVIVDECANAVSSRNIKPLPLAVQLENLSQPASINQPSEQLEIQD